MREAPTRIALVSNTDTAVTTNKTRCRTIIVSAFDQQGRCPRRPHKTAAM
jgi:hypothetical protein